MKYVIERSISIPTALPLVELLDMVRDVIREINLTYVNLKIECTIRDEAITLHTSTFDPRIVNDIYLRFRSIEEAMPLCINLNFLEKWRS